MLMLTCKSNFAKWLAWVIRGRLYNILTRRFCFFYYFFNIKTFFILFIQLQKQQQLPLLKYMKKKNTTILNNTYFKKIHKIQKKPLFMRNNKNSSLIQLHNDGLFVSAGCFVAEWHNFGVHPVLSALFHVCLQSAW